MPAICHVAHFHKYITDGVAHPAAALFTGLNAGDPLHIQHHSTFLSVVSSGRLHEATAGFMYLSCSQHLSIHVDVT